MRFVSPGYEEVSYFSEQYFMAIPPPLLLFCRAFDNRVAVVVATVAAVAGFTVRWELYFLGFIFTSCLFF
jgi:hypothetical protein